MVSNQAPLRFETFDDVVHYAEDLMKSGYTKNGKWNLAQICEHLADWMTFPMEGFPKAPLPIQWMLAILRVTIGKAKLKDALESGVMKKGAPTMPGTVHANAADDRASLKRLAETIEKFKRFSGEIIPSPLFGPMDKETATKLQLVHCAHHLSFLKKN